MVSAFNNNASHDLRTHLLHDTSFALRERDVSTRLILDELDLDLPSLAARLVIVIIVVVGGGGSTLTLSTSALDGAASILEVVIVVGRVWVVSNDLSRHDEVW